MFTGPAEFYEADVAKRKKLRPTISDVPKPKRLENPVVRDVLRLGSENIYTLRGVFEATRRA